jgi:hypothetical protein
MTRALGLVLFVAALFNSQQLCQGQFHTNTITSSGFAFRVDGGLTDNPVINLTAGVTNILRINTDGIHPVVISTNSSRFQENWFNGAAPQNINDGAIALHTPGTGFPAKLYYLCFFHGFFGEIVFTGPTSPVPPANLILSIVVGTNVVMTSTGTNTTWLMIPEFNSNLLSSTWAPVPSYTNTFANGTNTTVFDRLDPICGPNVFLRLRQQQN